MCHSDRSASSICCRRNGVAHALCLLLVSQVIPLDPAGLNHHGVRIENAEGQPTVNLDVDADEEFWCVCHGEPSPSLTE